MATHFEANIRVAIMFAVPIASKNRHRPSVTYRRLRAAVDGDAAHGVRAVGPSVRDS